MLVCNSRKGLAGGAAVAVPSHRVQNRPLARGAGLAQAWFEWMAELPSSHPNEERS